MSYVQIDGRPACERELTMKQTADFALRLGHVPVCAGRDKERDAALFREAFPGAVVEVVEGGCPAYAEDQDLRAENY